MRFHICGWREPPGIMLPKGVTVMFRRRAKIRLQLTAEERRLLLRSLVQWRNKLLAQGRCADPIDEMLMKLTSK